MKNTIIINHRNSDWMNSVHFQDDNQDFPGITGKEIDDALCNFRLINDPMIKGYKAIIMNGAQKTLTQPKKDKKPKEPKQKPIVLKSFDALIIIAQK